MFCGLAAFVVYYPILILETYFTVVLHYKGHTSLPPADGNSFFSSYRLTNASFLQSHNIISITEVAGAPLIYRFAFYQERAITYTPVLHTGLVIALVVSVVQIPWTESVPSYFSIITNIYAGLEDVVHATIFLGSKQVDLAIEPSGIDRVNQCFTNLNGLHLLSSDPLFAPKGNRSYAQTGFLALSEMRCYLLLMFIIVRY